MKLKSTGYLAALLICLGALLSNGCVRIYHYKKILVKVVDAETNQAIEGALVSSLYLRRLGSDGIFISKSPKCMSTRTDANGLARVRIATNSGIYTHVFNVVADGYIRVNPMIGYWHKNERIVTLYRNQEIVQ